MKAFRFIMTMAVAFTALSLCASAQPQRPQFPMGGPEGRQERPVRLTAKERAEKRTKEMDKTVNLDQKQYKKIYKIYLKEETAKDSAMENGFPMGPMGGGRPPQGGGFPGGFPGGMPPQGGGFSGGPGAGGPPSGMPSPGGFGQMEKPKVGGKEIDSDEYIDARETKFKKILSAEQYSKLRSAQPDPSGFFNNRK